MPLKFKKKKKSHVTTKGFGFNFVAIMHLTMGTLSQDTIFFVQMYKLEPKHSVLRKEDTGPVWTSSDKLTTEF